MFSHCFPLVARFQITCQEFLQCCFPEWCVCIYIYTHTPSRNNYVVTNWMAMRRNDLTSVRRTNVERYFTTGDLVANIWKILATKSPVAYSTTATSYFNSDRSSACVLYSQLSEAASSDMWQQVAGSCQSFCYQLLDSN